MSNDQRRTIQDCLRRLPSVDELLKDSTIQELLARVPRKLVVESLREALETARRHLLSHREDPLPPVPSVTELVQVALVLCEQKNAFTLQPVVNATGIVVHTNLGRSLLAEEALERLQVVCRSYSNLEYDLVHGRRGSRYVHAEAILREITGAEAALVVNNNAAAVLLVLNTLAKGQEVIVSRGQLVEIGGSFRIPDVMAASGAILREVGCTNRTHLYDYENAIGERTRLLMKVHCSNYRLVGFTAEVPLEDLVQLAHRHQLLVVEDLGSGSLVDVSPVGLPQEPTAQQALRAGVDVVTFSGDKLLGGPQAGIILGRKELIAQCKKNPLTRALRVDKMTLAALEATLRLYRDEPTAWRRIPTLEMIARPLEILRDAAIRLAQKIQERTDGSLWNVQVSEGFSQVGGGALPERNLPTYVVAVSSKRWSANQLEQFLRANNPPIIGRIESERFLMDLRTLRDGDEETIVEAFTRLAG
ncbi:MAG: L-seryl-tRNA(Sec) selenium transferase [Desulfosoma sp.]